MKNCPNPKCPADKDPWRKAPSPQCQCGKPLHIVIPAGGHIHPCPIHPDFIVYGPLLTW